MDTCFDNYASLEPDIDKYDVFLLDYLMPGTNGMQFAKTIREKYGSDKLIVFITQYDEIVYDAFVVQTYRFIKKPISKEKFIESLDSAINYFNKNDRIIIQYNGTTTNVKLKDIFFIEIRYKELYICTENEQFLCRRPIKSVEQEIDNKCFFRVHRSYLVNMENISSFTKQGIEFSNGDTIPISSRKYTEFCKAYFNMK